MGSLNRPGGNVTGVFFVAGSVEGKQLGLLREVVPKAAVIGMLVNPASPASAGQEREAQAAAHALGQQLHVFKASTERDIDSAFATLTQYQIGAVKDVAENQKSESTRQRHSGLFSKATCARNSSGGSSRGSMHP